MNPTSPLDSNIPVLTEIISGNSETKPISTVCEAISEEKAIRSQESSLDELKKTLHENVLRQLLTRVDFVLEHRIKESLADVLQTAVDDLAKDIRKGLTNTMEEIIHRAINQEITKIQSVKID
ncbi:MAG: hypothetical protein K0R08_417 [Solimicrobium sp.]|jgi:FKBP-type peptidyl-prolyl cis-trans isomerase (trigger factor)|nr:hypothetical protein [Solimicrobium sp.]